MKMSVKKLTLCSLLIALSFILANVKIMASIAFDSLPAFVGGLVLGGVPGAIIGAFAHLLTALLSGFPFTLPVHLITAGFMALTVYLFTLTYNLVDKSSNYLIASICAAIVGAALNGPFAVFALQIFLLPIIGEAGLFSFSITLTIAALVNIVLALIVYFILNKSNVIKDLK